MVYVNLSQKIDTNRHVSARFYTNIIIFAATKTITDMVRKLLFFAFLMTACATPKTVEEHHHHYQEVDSAAVQAIVDSRMGGWHEEMTQAIKVAIQSQQTEQNMSESSKERVTETITTWVDSLGREMRQEQRTTERDISRQQRLWEQRMSQQYEERLQSVTDSLNEVWQARMEKYQTHWAQSDSTSVSQKPIPADNRSWWERTREMLKWIAVGAALVILYWISRRSQTENGRE